MVGSWDSGCLVGSRLNLGDALLAATEPAPTLRRGGAFGATLLPDLLTTADIFRGGRQDLRSLLTIHRQSSEGNSLALISDLEAMKS